MKRIHVVILAACLATAAWSAPSADAGDWPGWRGPYHNGSTNETGLPATFGPEKNLRWAAPMPGVSSATPVIWGDSVFVASNDETLRKHYGICLDGNTGEERWRKQLAETVKVPMRNSLASCSPVTDGKLVYFLFGTGDLHALDFDGNPVWSVNLVTQYGPIGQQFGYSSSPLLYNGRLYLPILRGQWAAGATWASYTDKDSHLLCLDAATGALLWRVHRPSDAVGESFDSYASAVPYEAGATPAIVVIGGDYLTGSDPATGRELWRYRNNPGGKDMWRIIPSPVIAGDLICGVQPRGLDAFALRPGEKTRMAYTDATWIYEEKTTDVPTPLYYRGRLYILNGTRRILMCLDPATGNEIWTGNLGSSARIWASPTAADGKIFLLDEKGQVTVAAAGSRFEVLSQAEFGGHPSKSTIAIAQSNLFIRTADTLYCIGAGD